MAKKTKKAFTLIELAVSVGILAMIIAFASVIFSVSIKAQRIANANSEIMQNLQALTDQLNRDFRGLRKDAPLLIWFQQEVNLINPDIVDRYDQIMFFADGDFQSTQLYADPGTGYAEPMPDGIAPIVGNVARIFYGMAKVYQESNSMWLFPWWQDKEDDIREPILNKRQRMLGRRQHILTADSDIYFWPANGAAFDMSDPNLSTNLEIYYNDIFEHDSISLSYWKHNIWSPQTANILKTNFIYGHPPIDIKASPPFGLHNLMTQGLSSFAIQWSYWDEYDEELRWYPSDNPDGSGAYSHFEIAYNQFLPASSPHTGFDEFGNVFNLAGFLTYDPNWAEGENADFEYNLAKNSVGLNFYPKALKFTFRLHDAKGIIKETINGKEQKGRTFTHIVYLD